MTANDRTHMEERIERLWALFPGTAGESMTLQGAVDALVLQSISAQNIPAEGDLYGTGGTYSGSVMPGLSGTGERQRRTKETPYETVRALQKQSELLLRT